MKADQELFNSVVATLGVIVLEVQEHFINCHTTSEREQELLTEFADAIICALQTLKMDEGGNRE